MRNLTLRILPVLSVALGLTACKPAAAQYDVNDTGTLGGSSAYAYGVNSNRLVVGYSMTLSPHREAFLWQPLVALGLGGGINSLDFGGTGLNSYAFAVNGVNEVVGSITDIGFIWLPVANHGLSSGMTSIGTLGGLYSFAMGVNSAGQVVGLSDDVNGRQQAFVWQSTAIAGIGPGIHGLGSLPGDTDSSAVAINQNSQIVGTSERWIRDALGHYQVAATTAFLWLPSPAFGLNPGMNSLGTLKGDYSYASAINTAGQVVGCSSDRAILWLPTPAFGLPAGMNDLGTLGGPSSYALSINTAGDVVGSSEMADGSRNAFVWRAGAMINLNTMIPLASGWVLEEATGISDIGDIVGIGKINGERRAFLLTQPGALPQPAPSNITFSRNPVRGGAMITGTVVLGSPAPASGRVVELASEDPGAATLPLSVTVPPGAISASFPIATYGVPATTNVWITASANATVVRRSLTVYAAAPEHITFSPNPVRGGRQVTAKLFLNGKAPAGGLTITLGSETPSIATPAAPTVDVPEGMDSATFSVNTYGVASNSLGIITATASGVNIRIGLTVVGPAPEHMTFSPNPVRGGTPVTGTIILNGLAPTGGLVVNLGSETPSIAMPSNSTVMVPAGAGSATFPITTFGVSGSSMGILTASANGTSIRIGLDVVGSAPEHMTFNPDPVRGGNPTVGTLILNGKAPAGGLVVNLGSETPDIAAPGASTVTVPAGASTATFPITTKGVGGMSLGIMTASANGVSIRIGVTVAPAAPEHMTFSPNPVKGGGTVTGTLILNGQAPAGGLVVNLSSENPLVAAPMASTVTVPAGASSATFTIKTSAVGVLALGVLTASANGVNIRIGLSVAP